MRLLFALVLVILLVAVVLGVIRARKGYIDSTLEYE